MSAQRSKLNPQKTGAMTPCCGGEKSAHPLVAASHIYPPVFHNGLAEIPGSRFT
jgi:hypothetical protein